VREASRARALGTLTRARERASRIDARSERVLAEIAEGGKAPAVAATAAAGEERRRIHELLAEMLSSLAPAGSVAASETTVA
jgi:hypothetical protein